MRTVAWVDGIGRLTKQDLVALAHAADRVPTHVSNLAAVEGFEGQFDPAKPNAAHSGAIGCLQFMPKTMCALIGLANTPENRASAAKTFAAMTFVAQQEYVVKYLHWFNGHDLSSLENLYLAVFWPAAIGKSDDYVIARRPPADLPKEQWTFEHKVYAQNAGFDRFGNNDGVVTRGEICVTIRKFRATANSRPAIEIPEPDDVFISEDERREFANLVMRTSAEETETFRKGSPLPDDDSPTTIPDA